MNCSRLLVRMLAVCVAAVFMISGCGGKDEPPAEPSSDSANNEVSRPDQTPEPASPGSRFKVPDNPIAFDPNGPPVLPEPLELWKQGKQDEAIAAFVAIDWTSGPPFKQNSVLSLTEKEFNMLAPEDRDTAMNIIMAETTQIKNLCEAVVQKGASSPESDKYIQAVQNCAKVMLQNEDALSFIKLMATVIESTATQAG